MDFMGRLYGLPAMATFTAPEEESRSTEAKIQVLRYDGQVAKLVEYGFRVRLHQAKRRLWIKQNSESAGL